MGGGDIFYSCDINPCPLHNHPDVKQYDEEREKIIRSLGIEFLRFSNDDVLNKMDSVINTINSFIQDTLTKKQKEGTPVPPLGARGLCTP